MRTRRGRDVGVALTVASLAIGGALEVAEAKPDSAEKAPAAQPARIELGRRLFFEPAVTPSGLRSCADCHDPDHGFSDPARKSLDVSGTTSHHAQTLIDVADARSFHWHGELPSIASVIRQRTSPDSVYCSLLSGLCGSDDPDEPLLSRPSVSFLCPTPGRPTPPEDTFVADGALFERDALKALAAAGRYDEALVAAFGTTAVSEERVTTAIEAYCRTIRSGTSAYDRFAARDSSALSESARRGLEIFRGKGGCASCHSMTGPRATFTDQTPHDLHAEKAVTDLPAATRRPAERAPRLDPSPDGDSGFVESIRVVTATADPEGTLRKWKTPTLRDVARRGPYFHTGLATTLEDAIRFFRPPDATPGVVPADRPWTDDQVADVAAFLRSLTSDERPGRLTRTWSLRVQRTRLRFVDAGGAPLSNLGLTFIPAGDAAEPPGRPLPIEVTTSHDGRVTLAMPESTHLRVVLPGGLEPLGGSMIPDTCQSAQLQLPVRGTARVAVTFADASRAPETLVARHPGATRFPDRKLPATLLRRESLEPGRDGSVLATYAAPMRTDVPAVCVVELPGASKPVTVRLRRDATAVLTR